MIPSQLIECLKLQDSINCRVDPFWLKAGNSWSRAAMVESVELMDHIGWKWWKFSTTDTEQAKLELVDIWHFILSDVLVRTGGDVQAATRHILEQWERPLNTLYLREGNYGGVREVSLLEVPLIRRIEIFAMLAGLTGDIVIPLFRLIAEELGLTSTGLYTGYLCKNALNHFRQKHGYKNGTYTKIWFGVEDNVVLASIVKEANTISYDGLMTELEKAYTKATGGNHERP